MKDIQSSAKVFWEVINGRGVPESEFLEALPFKFSATDGVSICQPIPSLSLLLKALSVQPSTAELIQRWSSYFSSPVVLEDNICRQFVNEVFRGLEDVDSLYPQPIYSGQTTLRQGGFFDNATKRVLGKKKGWSLHLTTQGCARYNCIREQLTCELGDLVLISPTGVYDYERHPDSDLWSHRWIYFVHNESWMRWLRWREVGPGIYSFKVRDENYQTLLNLFLESSAVFDRKELGASELQRNITEQILIRCYYLQPSEHIKEMPDKVSQLTRYISEHFAEDFDLQMLAKSVGISRPRLSALFREHTGTSIMRWRDELRMSKACELLGGSSLNIGQIADRVGYSDPLYFSRTFRHHLGCSPSDYRNAKVDRGME